jgi:hypothetical protein
VIEHVQHPIVDRIRFGPNTARECSRYRLGR